MKFSISSADIDPLKAHLLALAPQVKSSHRVEAMARGLGFNSHAALRSAAVACPSFLRRGWSLERPRPSAFVQAVSSQSSRVMACQ